jgi:hypothetical protein
MDSVTIDRIDALRRHIADAVTQTSERSTLQQQEQDRILEQACGEACELLGDWLGSQVARSPAADDIPVRELSRDQQQFTDFLSPLFADFMKRARGDSKDDSAAIVQAASDEVARAAREMAATARRHPRMRSQQIFEVAAKRVGDLKGEVCKLADQLRRVRQEAERPAADNADAPADDARRSALRRKAVRVLRTVGAVLLPISVSLVFSAAGPQQVAHNVSAWTNAAEVLVVHDLAIHAQPGIKMAPPHAGPQLR